MDVSEKADSFRRNRSMSLDDEETAPREESHSKTPAMGDSISQHIETLKLEQTVTESQAADEVSPEESPSESEEAVLVSKKEDEKRRVVEQSDDVDDIAGNSHDRDQLGAKDARNEQRKQVQQLLGGVQVSEEEKKDDGSSIVGECSPDSATGTSDTSVFVEGDGGTNSLGLNCKSSSKPTKKSNLSPMVKERLHPGLGVNASFGPPSTLDEPKQPMTLFTQLSTSSNIVNGTAMLQNQVGNQRNLSGYSTPEVAAEFSELQMASLAQIQHNHQQLLQMRLSQEQQSLQHPNGIYHPKPNTLNDQGRQQLKHTINGDSVLLQGPVGSVAPAHLPFLQPPKDHVAHGPGMIPTLQQQQQHMALHQQQQPLAYQTAFESTAPPLQHHQPNHPLAASNNNSHIHTSTDATRPVLAPTASSKSLAASSCRRSIHLRLLEETNSPKHRDSEESEATVRTGGEGVSPPPTTRSGNGRFFFSRREPKKSSTPSEDDNHGNGTSIHRGEVVVSWYEGTSSGELQEHVRKSVCRKLGLCEGGRRASLEDVRLIDESVQPNEEIVISPFIPDGSRFLLKFTIKSAREPSPFPPEAKYLNTEQHFRPPDSPSAAPSPHPSSLDLVALQLQQMIALQNSAQYPKKKIRRTSVTTLSDTEPDEDGEVSLPPFFPPPRKSKDNDEDTYEKQQSPDFLKLQRLIERSEKYKMDYMNSKSRASEEKRQVVFVLANYFVLFLSVIAISAEIHERSPRWMEWVNKNVDSVQHCSQDQHALFECVSSGDFSGVIAAFIFFVTRSATTRQIFLFGFESPKKLWTVVYEAMVTAFCWGTSYTFIRRGLNPDTRQNFIQKYWKDAVYGSLAGFNAAFMKAVLKNLVPQDQVLDALESRQLKIVDWIGNLIRE